MFDAKEREIILLVEKFVKDSCEDVATGHDWYHIDRVRKNAKYLQSREGGNAFLIECAALLHDISDYKFNGGDECKGGEVSFRAMLDLGASEQQADAIRTIVNSVSFKGAKVADTTATLEAKIVQDADRLDAIGAIGIARTFAYGGHVGNPIYDPKIPFVEHDSFQAYKQSNSTTINHFYEKLLLLKGKMHTATAKQIAEERTDFMQSFLQRFYNEWNNEF